jgi:hypothetical protein
VEPSGDSSRKLLNVLVLFHGYPQCFRATGGFDTGKMAEKPKTEDDKEAEGRFQETLKRLANTPHQPHKAKQKRQEPKS